MKGHACATHELPQLLHLGRRVVKEISSRDDDLNCDAGAQRIQQQVHAVEHDLVALSVVFRRIAESRDDRILTPGDAGKVRSVHRSVEHSMPFDHACKVWLRANPG